MLRLDAELELAARGVEPLRCELCDGWTYDRTCGCSPDRLVDPAERLIAEKGDDVTQEDFEALWSDGGAEQPGDDDHERAADDGREEMPHGLFRRPS